jgi:hypothetical protein
MKKSKVKIIDPMSIPYAERIAYLVETTLPNISKIGGVDDLLLQLGCACLCWNFKPKWHIDPSEPTPPEHEDLVVETLLQFLRLYGAENEFIDDSHFSILDGLWTGNRWRRCLQNTNDAHALAALLLGVLERVYISNGALERVYISNDKDNYHEVVADFSHPIIMALASHWLGVTYTDLPTMERLTRDIFGDAWYEIVVANDAKLVANIPEVVRTLRPAFRRGLLAAALTEENLELPEIYP